MKTNSENLKTLLAAADLPARLVLAENHLDNTLRERWCRFGFREPYTQAAALRMFPVEFYCHEDRLDAIHRQVQAARQSLKGAVASGERKVVPTPGTWTAVRSVSTRNRAEQGCARSQHALNLAEKYAEPYRAQGVPVRVVESEGGDSRSLVPDAYVVELECDADNAALAVLCVSPRRSPRSHTALCTSHGASVRSFCVSI